MHSAVSGSTTRTSATISNAYRRSLRGKILAKAQAKVEARPKATTPARASRKDVVKVVKTRVKADEEEELTARTTTRTRTRTEVTPTLIQGGTPSPLEGSLDLPHAHRRRPSKNKGAKREHEGGDDGNAKKRKPFHEDGPQNCGTKDSR